MRGHGSDPITAARTLLTELCPRLPEIPNSNVSARYSVSAAASSESSLRSAGVRTKSKPEALLSSCWTVETPKMADVTSGLPSTQASAAWAPVYPRSRDHAAILAARARAFLVSLGAELASPDSSVTRSK